MAKLLHLAFRPRHKGLLASSPLIHKMNPVANEIKLPVISLRSVVVSHGMAFTHLFEWCPLLPHPHHPYLIPTNISRSGSKAASQRLFQQEMVSASPGGKSWCVFITPYRQRGTWRGLDLVHLWDWTAVRGGLCPVAAHCTGGQSRSLLDWGLVIQVFIAVKLPP